MPKEQGNLSSTAVNRGWDTTVCAWSCAPRQSGPGRSPGDLCWTLTSRHELGTQGVVGTYPREIKLSKQIGVGETLLKTLCKNTAMQIRHKRFHENIGSKREKGKTHMMLKRHLILPLRSGRDGQLIIAEAPLPVVQQLFLKNLVHQQMEISGWSWRTRYLRMMLPLYLSIL